jgi:hypothetical protein
LADLKEAERLCDSLLYSQDVMAPVLAIVPKARALHLRGKTEEARALLARSASILDQVTQAALSQGVPKEHTVQFAADLLRTEMDNKEISQQAHAR